MNSQKNMAHGLRHIFYAQISLVALFLKYSLYFVNISKNVLTCETHQCILEIYQNVGGAINGYRVKTGQIY